MRNGNDNKMRGGGGNRGRGGYRNYSGGGGGRNFQNQYHGNRYSHHYNPKPFIPHVPFDFIQVEHAFQRVKPVAPQDDKNLNDLLIKRNQDLTPDTTEQTQLLNLITKVQAVLDNLILAPGEFEACHLDEIKQVGSYKKGTMLNSPKMIADLCVVLKTLPTKEAVNQLANKVYEEVKKTIVNPLELRVLEVNLNESGFEILSAAIPSISNADVAVQVLVTTQIQNLRKLEPELHLDSRICARNLASIRHARWFDENASNLTIKVLIRLLKDIKSRFDGLQSMTPWIIDLIAHYAIMNNPKYEALPLPLAFRRVFQLISAGFFLPGSAGIIDPCENTPIRVHVTLTLEQQDTLCYTCQTLLRILAHGGIKQIIGLEGNSIMLTAAQSEWEGGVIVTPSIKVYEPSKEPEISGGDCDQQQDANNGNQGDSGQADGLKMETN